VNRALENVAIEAAEVVGIDKSKVYTMGGSTEPAKLKSIKYARSLSIASLHIPHRLLTILVDCLQRGDEARL
jgi:hypothetical protein